MIDRIRRRESLDSPDDRYYGLVARLNSNTFEPPAATFASSDVLLLYSGGIASFAGMGAIPGRSETLSTFFSADPSPDEITTLYLPGTRPVDLGILYLPSIIAAPDWVGISADCGTKLTTPDFRGFPLIEMEPEIACRGRPSPPQPLKRINIKMGLNGYFLFLSDS